MAARSDEPEAGKIEADIEQLKADLKRLNETLLGLGRDSLDAVQSEGAARLEALRRETDDIAQRLKSQGQGQYAALEAQIRDKPLLTLLAAFGLGLIISRLVDRH